MLVVVNSNIVKVVLASTADILVATRVVKLSMNRVAVRVVNISSNEAVPSSPGNCDLQFSIDYQKLNDSQHKNGLQLLSHIDNTIDTFPELSGFLQGVFKK